MGTTRRRRESTGVDLDTWIKAQKSFIEDDLDKKAEHIAAATALVELAGKDERGRFAIYAGLAEDEKRVVNIVMGEWVDGSLKVMQFDQPKSEWVSALSGVFALRAKHEQ